MAKLKIIKWEDGSYGLKRKCIIKGTKYLVKGNTTGDVWFDEMVRFNKIASRKFTYYEALKHSIELSPSHKTVWCSLWNK